MINNLSASPQEKKGGKEEEENSISVTTTQLFFVFSPPLPQVHEQSCHTLTLPLRFSCSGDAVGG